MVDLKGVGDQFGAMHGQERKGGKAAKGTKKAEEKKKAVGRKSPVKGGLKKTQKEVGPKKTEKQLKMEKELTAYLKSDVFEPLIDKAIAVGESLVVSRSIQTNFQSRPVTKFIYPMKMEFQYNVMGVQPKTVQTLDKLGQIMFLDSDNQLNQYDVCTTKMI
jgi:hypothetical protein